MRYIFWTIFIIAIFGIGSFTAYTYYYALPDKFENGIKTSLKSLGFKNVTYAVVQRKHGLITINQVSLDTKSFSGIENITVRYSPWGTLFYGQKADSIEIKNLNLAGELTNELTLTVAGWKNDGSLLKTLSELPAQKIIIQNSRLELLSPLIGGIDIEYEGEIKQTENQEIEIFGNARTIQKNLEAEVKISGSINRNGTLEITAQSENLKVDTNDFVMRRTNASISMLTFSDTIEKLSIEANAASVVLFDMPLQDTNINIEKNDSGVQIYAEGKTTGSHQSEFSAQINHNSKQLEYDVSIHPNYMNELIHYLQSSQLLPIDGLNFPRILLKSKEPIISIQGYKNADGKMNGFFKLQSQSPEYEIAGDYVFETQNRVWKGDFYLPRSFVDFLPQANKTLETRKGIAISGQGNFIYSFNKNTPQFSWSMENKIEPSNFDFHGLGVKDIKGKVGISSKSSSMKHVGPQLSFKLPFVDSIDQHGIIELNNDDITLPFVKNFKLNLMDGTIETRNINLSDIEKPTGLVFDITDINLSTFAQSISLKNFYLGGKVGGQIPLIMKDGQLTISKGLIQSQQPGFIRMPNEFLNRYFLGQDEKVRRQLKYFDYEFFEIRLDGPINGLVMMSIIASGRNTRDSEIGSMPNLDFTMQVKLSDIFQNILLKDE